MGLEMLFGRSNKFDGGKLESVGFFLANLMVLT